jgi:hypothetical protein
VKKLAPRKVLLVSLLLIAPMLFSLPGGTAHHDGISVGGCVDPEVMNEVCGSFQLTPSGSPIFRQEYAYEHPNLFQGDAIGALYWDRPEVRVPGAPVPITLPLGLCFSAPAHGIDTCSNPRGLVTRLYETDPDFIDREITVAVYWAALEYCYDVAHIRGCETAPVPDVVRMPHIVDIRLEIP